MAKLTRDDVLHVAKLAKLDLTDSEVDKYASQLSQVVDYMSELSEVDTEEIVPTSQTTGMENIKRPDSVTVSSSLSSKEALSGSNSVYNGYFKVKAILEGRTDK